MDDTKVILGESRLGAIDRVQEILGPVTPRPLAEKTFWALARAGKITMDEDGVYLIEAEVDEKQMRDTALQQFKQSNSQPRRGMRHFTINHKNMFKARISTSWQAMISALTPVFEGDGLEAPEDDD